MITERKIDPATVPTPASGTLTLFINLSGKLCMKDEGGTVALVVPSTPTSYMRAYNLSGMALTSVDAVPAYLEILDLSLNQLTAIPAISSAISLKRLLLTDNNMSEALVNAMLAACKALAQASAVSNVYLDLKGNSVPGAAGLTDKTALEGLGWTVLVNE